MKTLRYKDIPNNGDNEEFLKILSSCDRILCDSADERYLAYGWLLQAGKVPKTGDICLVGEQGLVEGSDIEVFSSEPAFGEVFERTYQETRFRGSLNEVRSINQLLLPSSHVRKIGLKIVGSEGLVFLKTLKGKTLTETKVDSSRAIHWLELPKFFTPAGGEKLVVEFSNLDCKTSVLDSRLEVIFLSSDYSSIAKLISLSRRAIRMLKEGEWKRFSSAIQKRLFSVMSS